MYGQRKHFLQNGWTQLWRYVSLALSHERLTRLNKDRAYILPAAEKKGN
jgi:hypothetical protein